MGSSDKSHFMQSFKNPSGAVSNSITILYFNKTTTIIFQMIQQEYFNNNYIHCYGYTEIE